MACEETLWAALVGGPGDYMLSLHLGAQERRSARLANPRLSFLQRTYEGSIGFLIECPWRLDGPDGSLASYLAFLEPLPAPVDGALSQMIGLKLLSFHLDARSKDLDLNFEGDLRLRCFCAEMNVTFEPPPRAQAVDSKETRRRNRTKVRNNWSFWTPEGSVVVGPSGQISTSEEQPLEKMRRRLREIMDEEPEELDRT